jgi:glycosyltransferase involved in cell wall biosynthesis
LFTFKNKIILILSPEDWGANLLSKHLYAQELSKNNTVYFLHTCAHSSQKTKLETTFINENLTLIHLKNVARGLFKLPSFCIDLQNNFIIKKILTKINQPIDVVWSFDQAKFQNLKQFKAKKTIFHPVDYIAKESVFLTKIANNADVVLSVSTAILNKIKTTTPKHFVNHGIDEIFFQEKEKFGKPNYMQSDTINIGYVGNLQMKLIDYENLIKTVRENPTLNFVFIGPDKKSNLGGQQQFNELDTLKSFQNTYFAGEFSKTDLVKTLPFFDVLWLCYNHKKYPIEVSNSHKILEYLSAGKVVVSNYISTYKNETILEMVMDNNLLADKLKEVTSQIALFNSTEKQQQRITFAKENIYKKQLERIENIINSLNG